MHSDGGPAKVAIPGKGRGMRKVMTLGAFMTLALLLASGVALAATINGTNGADFLIGTPNTDTINGYKGDDIIGGKDAADTLRGYEGNDIINGGDDNDSLYG